MKKEKINSINFIKAICALGIISAHFSHYLINRNFLIFYSFANGGWGSVFAQIFFIVSGALLFYNYEDELKIKTYYKKRWVSIFPTFYMAYILVFVTRIIKNKMIPHRKLFPYIFTILGMDGYLINNTTTYYILGEWFLGMIIILYLMFPFILKLFKKSDFNIMCCMIIMYILFLDKSIINPEPNWSITSCGLSFIFGMFIIKNRKVIINKVTVLISIIAVLLLVYLPINQSADVCLHLTSGYLFIVLMFVGEWIMKNKISNKIFGTLSKYSYAIFLLQHIIITAILSRYNPSQPFQIFGLLIFDILITFIMAIILTKITNITIKTISKTTKTLQKRKISNL